MNLPRQLQRSWFVVVLLGGVAMALLWPGLVSAGVGGLHPAWVIALALLLMSWTLPTQRLLRVLRTPGPALWAVLLSYGFVPLMGHWMGQLLPDEGLRLGLILIASVPCTMASAVLWTRRAGGNDAMALLIIVLATAISWLLTPSCLVVFGISADVHIDGLKMMQELFVVLILPVALGQLFRSVKRLANFADSYQTPLGVLSQLLIVAIMLKAVSSIPQQISAHATTLSVGVLMGTALLSAGLHLSAFGVGWFSSRWMKLTRADQIAVAFGCSQKTLPVALFLFEHYFRSEYPLAILPVVFFPVSQLLLDTVIAECWASRGLAFSDAVRDNGF